MRAAPNNAPGQSSDEIVVTAPRFRGSVNTPHQPLLLLDKTAIRALGAVSLEKLLDRIQPVTRGVGGTRPIILLNGRRIASEQEIATLPPEAVEQIEVLPEPVAAQFGHAATARVINIVTARRFTSLEADAGLTLPTGGDGQETKGKGSGTLLRGDLRLLLVVSRETKADITEGLALPDPAVGFGETLRPAEQAMKISGSAAGPIGRALNASLAVDYQHSAQTSRASLADAERRDGLGTAQPAATAGALRSQSTALGATASVQGFVDRWSWNSTLILRSASSRQEIKGTEELVAPASRRDFERNIDISATGPFILLPGGWGYATLRVGAGTERVRSTKVSGVQHLALRRRTTNATLSVSLPLTPSDRGAFTLDGSAELSEVSAQGRQAGWTAGLSASPLPFFQLSINYARRATPPTLSQVAAPTFIVPGTPFFDRLAGANVVIDLILGGNPDLHVERRQSFDLGVEFQPFADRPLRIGATYSLVAVKDFIVSIGASDPALELAFPMLYRRDPGGTLVSVSSRPVNVHALSQRSLRWSLSYGGDVRAADAAEAEPGANGASPLFLFVNIDGTVRLRDRVTLAAGLPPLNLLEGAVFDGGGGRARFELLALASISTLNFGADLGVRWRSSVRQAGNDPATDLTFSSLLAAQAGVFYNFEALGPTPWLRGLRLELSVDNIGNARPRVRDRNGNTPVSLMPRRLDPRGRAITITFRKLF
jgi:iron complex outermembrane recepter protein